MALAAAGQCQVHDRVGRRVVELHDGLAHFGRQLVSQAGDHVTHLIRGLNHVFVERELNVKSRSALKGTGIHLGHAGNAHERLLQPVHNFTLGRVG